MLTPALIVLAASSAAAPDVEVALETCGSVSATVVDGELCHVFDIAEASTYWKYTQKFGVILDTKTVGIGAGFSHVFKVEIKFAKSEFKTRKEVEAAIRRRSADIAKNVRAKVAAKGLKLDETMLKTSIKTHEPRACFKKGAEKTSLEALLALLKVSDREAPSCKMRSLKQTY